MEEIEEIEWNLAATRDRSPLRGKEESMKKTSHQLRLNASLEGLNGNNYNEFQVLQNLYRLGTLYSILSYSIKLDLRSQSFISLSSLLFIQQKCLFQEGSYRIKY